MIKRSVYFLTFLVTFSCFATALAAPVNFTFSGEVDSVNASSGIDIAPGDLFTYNILIDMDRTGEQSTWDGTQYVAVDPGASTGFPTFYAEFLDGFLINDSLISTTSNPVLLNYGFATIAPLIFLGSSDHQLTLSTIDGTNWLANEAALDSNGVIIEIISGGTLQAVPLPASLPLLCAALLGLAGFRRKNSAE